MPLIKIEKEMSSADECHHKTVLDIWSDELNLRCTSCCRVLGTIQLIEREPLTLEEFTILQKAFKKVRRKWDNRT